MKKEGLSIPIILGALGLLYLGFEALENSTEQPTILDAGLVIIIALILILAGLKVLIDRPPSDKE